ncbi:anthranilate phosphoribosyltransferase [Corynebacterium sp. 320]|uniref:Anthranilate phosphoribosyltransferase n=1 Tax=Corynebacterium zhongnanshanii TaxID=2768834 RepID=A0ABQ6VDA2_9CORY|nr:MULTISPECIES: anthranilate phosphoribosyltransferase [Corynebacterium]KAB1502476.1 anthranilate phosphoribosyltransferase [Corynebacterium sp. 320]KAB1551303.1 anthranilate phosphoribosyltransferase [Corynebacterium sp. 321]KAB1551869.1 anthranilate phosphoribosyltransferase [Corynebacterium sp. 319]KAB3520842.1 anthranilate phosphoribosyltransferase [Corynebacterium zhongnanshanii]KAB3526083.1 anthranilate phosphoribosyltransferase [Corynebacterium sp. 250]
MNHININSDTADTPASRSSQDWSWPGVLNLIGSGDALPDAAVHWAMSQIMGGEATPAQISAFAFGIKVKGITPEELAAAAETMSSFAQTVDTGDITDAVDIVGTGGDGHHTVNISTMASFVLAGLGTTVVKHGNRAASSKCGGADLLEQLGYRIERTPEEIVKDMARTHFGFMFAKTYHPAMRFAGPVRSELKVPTLFNLLGPLTNPAQPRYGLIGCAFEDQQEVMARAFAQRGDRVLVVRGHDGMDEITISGPTHVVATNSDGSITHFDLSPEDYGFETASLESLRGGDAAFNATVAQQLFAGELDGPVKAAVLMNAAAARATVTGWGDATDADSIKEAILQQLPFVRESLESGAAQKALLTATS